MGSIITDPVVLRAPIRRSARSTSTRADAEVTTYDVNGRKIQYECLQCVHCQRTWRKVEGSGKKRGFCKHCMGPTCGKKGCETRCLPIEKRIDILQKWGRHALLRELSS